MYRSKQLADRTELVTGRPSVPSTLTGGHGFVAQTR